MSPSRRRETPKEPGEGCGLGTIGGEAGVDACRFLPEKLHALGGAAVFFAVGGFEERRCDGGHGGGGVFRRGAGEGGADLKGGADAGGTEGALEAEGGGLLRLSGLTPDAGGEAADGGVGGVGAAKGFDSLLHGRVELGDVGVAVAAGGQDGGDDGRDGEDGGGLVLGFEQERAGEQGRRRRGRR